MQKNETRDRIRLQGLSEGIKHAIARGHRQVRISKLSASVQSKLEGQGHRFSEPDDDGRVIMTIFVPAEVVIDNPDPPTTP